MSSLLWDSTIGHLSYEIAERISVRFCGWKHAYVLKLQSRAIEHSKKAFLNTTSRNCCVLKFIQLNSNEIGRVPISRNIFAHTKIVVFRWNAFSVFGWWQKCFKYDWYLPQILNKQSNPQINLHRLYLSYLNQLIPS